MNESEIQQYAMQIATQQVLAELSYPFGEDIHVFKVMNKIFLLTSTAQGQIFVNLKVQPEQSEILRELYPSIKMGYHMNKRHWISVYAGEKIDAQLIEDLVKTSYQLVTEQLTKKQKQALAIHSTIQ
ncbi:MmcQ/YjbR family DNA-binding protein [Acinetobacter sichuanensis]|uniref:MmcQ/YjbR family DNA-binding protein n=1 Tax=Acinetobacter sichuanensis TaxID=2136183 RepID=UPI00280CFABB|nr:MmcQ/YjbR family DNA-binding protein [Acinetobacter sichuanensis]MDQ9021562.1 MmcQ/YjbR family DNA-binding protein [Acinetobacter sichuanensis]